MVLQEAKVSFNTEYAAPCKSFPRKYCHHNSNCYIPVMKGKDAGDTTGW